MFKKILLVLVILIAAFAGYVAMQPNSFRIARSSTISAPPAAVFAQVNDFHNWGEWDPWAKLDPNAKSTFAGPESGKDAVLTWDGNNEVGKGKMTIVESKPNDLIRLRLDFERPMQSTADVEFTFKPVGDKTEVTWTMSGENNFIGKAMCTFMNMDDMVGTQFEKGLAGIKKIVEAPPQAATDKPAAASPAADVPDPIDPFKK